MKKTGWNKQTIFYFGFFGITWISPQESIPAPRLWIGNTAPSTKSPVTLTIFWVEITGGNACTLPGYSRNTSITHSLSTTNVITDLHSIFRPISTASTILTFTLKLTQTILAKVLEWDSFTLQRLPMWIFSHFKVFTVEKTISANWQSYKVYLWDNCGHQRESAYCY